MFKKPKVEKKDKLGIKYLQISFCSTAFILFVPLPRTKKHCWKFQSLLGGASSYQPRKLCNQKQRTEPLNLMGPNWAQNH